MILEQRQMPEDQAFSAVDEGLWPPPPPPPEARRPPQRGGPAPPADDSVSAPRSSSASGSPCCSVRCSRACFCRVAIQPDLILIFALAMGLRGGGLQGLILAFGAGFVLDVLSVSPLGLYALLCGTACAATRLFDKALYLRAAGPVGDLRRRVRGGELGRCSVRRSACSRPRRVSDWAELLIRAPRHGARDRARRRAAALGVPAPAQRIRQRGRLARARHARPARSLVHRLTSSAPPSDGTVERRLRGISLLVVVGLDAAADAALLPAGRAGRRLQGLRRAEQRAHAARAGAARRGARSQLRGAGRLASGVRGARRSARDRGRADDADAHRGPDAAATSRRCARATACRAGARASSRSASRTISIATRWPTSRRGCGRSAAC